MNDRSENDWRLSGIALIPAVVGFLALMAGIGYCVFNESGHSGFDPRIGGVFFIPILTFAFVLERKGKTTEASLTAAVGLLGMAFGFFVRGFDIMQPYEVWVRTGLPVRSPDSLWYLMSYAVLSILVMLLAFGATQRRPRQG